MGKSTERKYILIYKKEIEKVLRWTTAILP